MHFKVKYNVSNNGNVKEVVDLRKAYMLFCENTTDYIVKLPSRTIIVTQILGFLILVVISSNIQYRRFLPFTFNIFTCLVYIILLTIGLYLQNIFGATELVFGIQKYSIGIFEYICLVLYSQDLFMMCQQRHILAFIMGFAFSTLLIGLDFFLPGLKDAWFLNGIIAIMTAGAIVKFVIIRKIKTAVWALLIMWVFCLLR